jgi:hypothetical protein
MKPVGEPDAVAPHVRFDERGWETGRCRMAQATAPILDSTRAGLIQIFVLAAYTDLHLVRCTLILILTKAHDTRVAGTGTLALKSQAFTCLGRSSKWGRAVTVPKHP